MWAAATAISCFVLAGSAASVNTRSLNAWNAAWMAGVSSRRLRARSCDAGGYIDSDMTFSPSALLNLQRSPDFSMLGTTAASRSEERRVGKESKSHREE